MPSRPAFERLAPYLDERARRLFAANEALTAGWGGVTAVSEATGVARSTIGRGLAELQSESAPLSRRIRRRIYRLRTLQSHVYDLGLRIFFHAFLSVFGTDAGLLCAPERDVERKLVCFIYPDGP